MFFIARLRLLQDELVNMLPSVRHSGLCYKSTVETVTSIPTSIDMKTETSLEYLYVSKKQHHNPDVHNTREKLKCHPQCFGKLARPNLNTLLYNA
jgi:hypothetical protein